MLTMRKFHRILGLISAFFFVYMAFTGLAISQFSGVWRGRGGGVIFKLHALHILGLPVAELTALALIFSTLSGVYLCIKR
ncbi:hypothetical protein [Desulfotomaculum copahuensis]|uniref:PepSY domain-containing protein n=1 Tax=Desulfotomaculum copahuensis TaxID=1838280 RepID=A0A1B7LB07_9FIRM|nr:hypothetical protein [Desulfotomaculum copahuensis]OAT79534.1 hypothetical protein A6M21_15680 [Desulfotomaculum copahuensis]